VSERIADLNAGLPVNVALGRVTVRPDWVLNRSHFNPVSVLLRVVCWLADLEVGNWGVSLG